MKYDSATLGELAHILPIDKPIDNVLFAKLARITAHTATNRLRIYFYDDLFSRYKEGQRYIYTFSIEQKELMLSKSHEQDSNRIDQKEKNDRQREIRKINQAKAKKLEADRQTSNNLMRNMGFF